MYTYLYICTQTCTHTAHPNIYVYVYIHKCIYMVCILYMRWLRLVGSFKLYVSFAGYSLFYRALLQKRPIILRPTNRSHLIARFYKHAMHLLICVHTYAHKCAHTAHLKREIRVLTRTPPTKPFIYVYIYIYTVFRHFGRGYFFNVKHDPHTQTHTDTSHTYTHTHTHVYTYTHLTAGFKSKLGSIIGGGPRDSWSTLYIYTHIYVYSCERPPDPGPLYIYTQIYVYIYERLCIYI